MTVLLCTVSTAADAGGAALSVLGTIFKRSGKTSQQFWRRPKRRSSSATASVVWSGWKSRLGLLLSQNWRPSSLPYQSRAIPRVTDAMKKLVLALREKDYGKALEIQFRLVGNETAELPLPLRIAFRVPTLSRVLFLYPTGKTPAPAFAGRGWPRLKLFWKQTRPMRNSWPSPWRPC